MPHDPEVEAILAAHRGDTTSPTANYDPLSGLTPGQGEPDVEPIDVDALIAEVLRRERRGW